jgi:hypothetical protein
MRKEMKNQLFKGIWVAAGTENEISDLFSYNSA